MLKVMHLLNTGKYSGAENVAITIINNTKNKFNHVYVSLDGEIRKVLEQNRIEFCSVNKLNYSELKRVVDIYNPDIIHAHDFTASIIASFFKGKIKVISHLHSNPLWLRNLGVYSIFYFLRTFSFEKILCVSDSIQDEYIFGNYLKNKMITVGNPLDVEAVIKKSNEINIKEKFDLIFIGRFCKEKNPMFFLKVVENVIQIHPNLKVAILGDGEYRNEMEDILKEKEMDNKVKLYGFINNPYPYLKNSKILCMTSLWEGYGLVAVEALALNKPVLAPPVGGLVNIVNSDCGMLCDSLEEFTRAIISLLNNEELYKQKSLGAKKRLIEISNLDSYMDFISKIYNN